MVCDATVTLALAETDPLAARTSPLPAAAAVNVVDVPFVALSEPGAVVVQFAPATLTAFPNASVPLAVKVWEPPTVRLALDGDTVIVWSGAAATVSVWVTLVNPLALAVRVAVPAWLSL
jgi:hypothetical protein